MKDATNPTNLENWLPKKQKPTSQQLFQATTKAAAVEFEKKVKASWLSLVQW